MSAPSPAPDEDRRPSGPDWSPPAPSTAAALAVVVGVLLVIQVRAGLFAQPALVVSLGLILTVSTIAVPLVWPGGGGVLPGVGLSAAGVTQALVIAADGPSSLIVAVLGLWLPAAAVTLALGDEDQRSRLRPLVPVVTRSGPRPAAAVRGRAARSALGAAALVAVVAALAAAFVRPPGRGDGRGSGRDWDDVARAGRAATSLGIYQAGDRLDTARRFELSDEVVMRVRADEADFWRGTSYDQWDGRAWSRTGLTAADEGRFPDGAGSAGRRAADGAPSVETETLVQTFTVVAGGSDLLFGAYRPVQHLVPGGQAAVEDDGTATVGRPLGPGARYGVVSRRPVVTADLLRRADPLAAPIPDELVRRHLTLPAVPERVRRLAAEVTADQPTTYDKVRALESWMGRHTTYTLDIPPLPEGADTVEQFLFVDRRGYCEQIASSLAVMLRSVGVPARLGVGYAPGERSWGRDEFVVRGRDAHAWVEVWFPGVGWQAFDPTAEVPLSGEETANGAGRFAWWAALVVAGVVLALVMAVVVRRRRRRRVQRWEATVLARLEEAGGRRGRPRRAAETASEYASALADGVLASPGLHEVAAILERSTFGPPDSGGSNFEDGRQRAERLVDEAIAAAPPTPRRRSAPVSVP